MPMRILGIESSCEETAAGFGLVVLILVQLTLAMAK
jgi:tRNA A37 threonylcarbamoyltransferase TsaD